MKIHRKIAWLLALIVTLIFFLATFIQSPTYDIARLLGRLAASAGVGIVVFLVTYVIGALVVWMKR